MSKDDGGATFKKCCRCGLTAERKQGHQWLCAPHYRFGSMRTRARRDGKAVPSWEELEALRTIDTHCSDCGEYMVWLAVVGNRHRQATLQHYRNGSFGLVCLSCNTRHAAMPDDSYRCTPKDHKYCPQCKAVKPFSDYAKDGGRSGPMKLKSWCKQCSSEAHREWRKNKAA